MVSGLRAGLGKSKMTILSVDSRALLIADDECFTGETISGVMLSFLLTPPVVNLSIVTTPAATVAAICCGNCLAMVGLNVLLPIRLTFGRRENQITHCQCGSTQG